MGVVNDIILREACLACGLVEPISIESDGSVWVGEDGERTYPDMTSIMAEYERLLGAEDMKQVERLRQAAYAAQSDPIFFLYQRGDATEQEWLDAVDAVKAQFPYPA
jgi:hypothetical protein